MRWEEGRRSDNVEDRRGMPVSRKVLVGAPAGSASGHCPLGLLSGLIPGPSSREDLRSRPLRHPFPVGVLKPSRGRLTIN